MAAVAPPTDPVFESILRLEADLKRITSGADLRGTNALNEVKELRACAQGLKSEIILGISTDERAQEALHRALKDRPIPLSKARALMALLATPSIQLEDELKRTLSEVTRLFWELACFQTTLKGTPRGLYEDNVAELNQQAQKILKTLPKSEVETRFHIKCCEAISTCLQPGDGKWKGIARNFAPALTKAALQSILSRSPGPAVPVIIDLSIAVYRSIEPGWYRHTWAVNWGKNITTPPEFNRLVEYVNKHEEKRRNTFCLISIIEQIFENSSEELKEHLFANSPSSLLNLAEKTLEPGKVNEMKQRFKEKFKIDMYWKIRCYSVTVIGRIIENDRTYIDKSKVNNIGRGTSELVFTRHVIVRAACKDTNKYVCEAAGHALDALYKWVPPKREESTPSDQRALEQGIELAIEERRLAEEAPDKPARTQQSGKPARTQQSGGPASSDDPGRQEQSYEFGSLNPDTSSSSTEPVLSRDERIALAQEKLALYQIQLENVRLIQSKLGSDNQQL